MSEIDRAISAATGSPFKANLSASLSGGCINKASRLQGEDGREYFVKKNRAAFLLFFEAEGKALEEISGTQSIHAPGVIASGREGGDAFLVLEYIQEGSSRAEGQAQLGRLLAELGLSFPRGRNRT